MSRPTVSVDTAVLGALGLTRAYLVERAMHEVQLKDGTLHAFHHVRLHGLRDRYLRALRYSPQVFVVVDLRDLAPALGPEIPGYLERDVPGLVKYTLRPIYATKAELHEAASSGALGVGTPEPLQ